MSVRIIHPRYILFIAVLAVAVPALAALLPLTEAVIAGFDLAVFAFAASCAPLWSKGDAEVMRRQARRDDAGQFLLLVLSGLISSVVLVALTLLILDKDKLGAGGIALLVVTLAASWIFTNLIFAFHYARLYYTSEVGEDHEGLDFPGGCVPDFTDFLNFAFVIGMTCQTADITITKTAMRRISTFHGLFAFAFNLGILALSVNVLAGAGSN